MTWYDPRNGSAEAILYAEAKSPSPVYFVENEALVGESVEKLPEDVSMDKMGRK